MSTEFFDQVLQAMNNGGGTAQNSDGKVFAVTENHIIGYGDWLKEKDGADNRDLPPMPEVKA